MIGIRVFKRTTRVRLLVLQIHILNMLKGITALRLLALIKLILKRTNTVQQLALLKRTRKRNHYNAQLMVLLIRILKRNIAM